MLELKQVKATGAATGQVATVQTDGSLSPEDFTGVNSQAVCKGWVNFNGTGTIAIRDSFNVTSLTDLGVGDYQVNWDVDFDNVDYSPAISTNSSQGNTGTLAVWSVQVQTRSTSNDLQDVTDIYVQAFGDMANLSVGGSAPGVKVDSLCKGWVALNGTGTIAIRDSFNVAAITDNGVGDYTVNWDVDFDNDNYSTTIASGAPENNIISNAVDSLRFYILNSSGSNIDSASVNIHAFGDNPIALSSETGVRIVGETITYPGSTAPSGWIILTGASRIATLGNAASGADRADADAEILFTLYWDSMADAQAAVSSGRGASASADFAANKTITLPDYRGRSLIGTGTGSGLTARTNGAVGGAETHQLIIAELAAHGHGVNSFQVASSAGASNFIKIGGGSFTGSTGSDTAHNNMQPWLALNLIQKL